jgi:hypothetical protein
VTQAGVGTNRYAYAGGDPVNLSDPGGNCFGSGACKEAWNNFKADVTALASSFTPDKTLAGAVTGATAGATYTGTAGVTAACVGTSCTTAPVAGGLGALTGGIVGGLVGGSAGLITDVVEAWPDNDSTVYSEQGSEDVSGVVDEIGGKTGQTRPEIGKTLGLGQGPGNITKTPEQAAEDAKKAGISAEDVERLGKAYGGVRDRLKGKSGVATPGERADHLGKTAEKMKR